MAAEASDNSSQGSRSIGGGSCLAANWIANNLGFRACLAQFVVAVLSMHVSVDRRR